MAACLCAEVALDVCVVWVRVTCQAVGTVAKEMQGKKKTDVD